MTAVGVRVVHAKRRDASWLMRIAPVASLLALMGTAIAMMWLKPPLLQPTGFLLLVLTIAAFVWVQRWIQRRTMAPMKDGSFLGDSEIEIDAHGFRSHRSKSESSVRWSLVNEITHTSDHVFVWIDAYSALVLPVRDIPGMNARDAVLNLEAIRATSIAAPEVGEPAPATISGGAISDETISSDAPTLVHPARPSVRQELRALGRLLTWGLVDKSRLYGRDLTILLLSLFSFLLWTGLDRFTYDGEVDFYVYGLTEATAPAFGVLFFAWLISRLTRPRIEFRQGLLLTLGFLPLFIVAMWLTGTVPDLGVIFIAAVFVVCGDRYLRAGLRSITGTNQIAASLVAIVGSLLLAYLWIQYYYAPSIWVERDEETEQSQESERNQEQIVFEQSARIDAEMTSLAPRDPGKSNFFFVGFAGFGGQRVFGQEIGLAAKQIGARYGSERRSILLVNDERDVLKFPLATVPSLRHTLNALSQRMNPDDDVLFLSLSSHGSEDGTVSVSTDLGSWRDLAPEELADMLRESGIRWRVIVVSACYSGTFIEPLKDDHTIILTASAADRTSFGCSDDNDLTYFGEAFYRDALPKAPSLRAAFEAARAEIHEREIREGEEPSEPQAYFGKAIEQKLATIEAARQK